MLNLDSLRSNLSIGPPEAEALIFSA
jgi:hypothetical protein